MKSLLLITCYLIVVTSFAQDKIEGVGRLKINQTSIAIIDELARQQHAPVEVADSQMKLMRMELSRVYELKRNEKDPYDSPIGSSACQRVRVFLIPSYEVAGIAFKRVYLTFLNDILIQFDADSSKEIQEAFAAKYGPAQMKSKSNPSGCAGQVDNSYSYMWNNGDITALDFLSSSKSSNCREYLSHTFSVSSNKAIAQVEACEEGERATSQKAKAAKLKDL